MTERPMRLGLIGAGGIGSAYLEALATSATVEVVAIADERPDAATKAAEPYGARSYQSHVALAENGGCEAVLVCTPPVTHEQIGSDCIDRNLSVLCEKPFGFDGAAARALVDRAAARGVLLTMASKFRFVEDVVRAKRIVDAGILGEIILFENTFTSRVDMRTRWNAVPEISGGGVLIDNGTHSVDLARFFLGPIARVHAVDGKRAQDLAVEDTAQMFVESRSGVMGTIDLSWSLNKDRSSYVEIHGTNGTIRVGWAGSTFRQASSPDWITFGTGYRKLDALRAQAENFADALAGREPLRITPHDAIASVDVIQAAYASMGRDHWETVTSEVLAEPGTNGRGARPALTLQGSR
jgi:predicted dehydrogenase